MLFARSEGERYARTRELLRAPSHIRLSFRAHFAKGSLLEEEYRMADIDGVSTVTYRVIGRNGVVIRVESAPRASHDVPFLFEQTVRDGIWELRDEPPRGDTSVRYAISVAQTAAGAHGSHAMTFTDPHYWATTAGRQYHLHLDRDKPIPDMLRLRSTALAEPRYQKLVDDFRSFGSPELRAKIRAARAQASHPAPR